MTKFFEPISISATHIYHSALELSPKWSIVRQFYYHRASRITRLPRVVVGTPDSWDPSISTSGKHHYQFCTWSPCGRFVAASMGNTVEIRNHLTFELLTTLQSTETTPLLAGPLAYSPDGRSIACSSNTAIFIWDIQTGGVAGEIHRDGTEMISLVWSLDGRTIGTLQCDPSDTWHAWIYVNTYDVASGTPLSTETTHSSHKPHLWADNESFRVMTTERSPFGCGTIEIQIKGSKVRSLSNTIQTFGIRIQNVTDITATIYDPFVYEFVTFSPTTGHVSVLIGYKLFICQERSPLPLLEALGSFLSACFSSDGSLFAASDGSRVRTWEYTSGRYNPWRDFRCQTSSPQFSPISTLLLSLSGGVLQVWRLDDLPKNPQRSTQGFAAISRSGCRVAATDESRTSVSITDTHSQGPPQFVDTGMVIKGLFLTGSVLLVAGSDKVVAWLLKEEAQPNGVFDGGIFNSNDSIWATRFATLSLSSEIRVVPILFPQPILRVEGQIGVIERFETAPFLYCTSTGEVLQSVQAPPHVSPGLKFTEGLSGRHHPYCHNLPQCNSPPSGSWCPSEAALRHGWVKDPEGRHRLWLHVKWRKSWDVADWCHDIAAQFSIVEGQPVIVKF